MRLLPACLALVICGCHAAGGDVREAAAPSPVTIMTFNVENLFDTLNDPDKDDDTFLPLAAKQNDAHRAACAPIPVERWRNQCLYWDWNDDVLATKLSVIAQTILQIGDGRGPDIVALQEIENLDVLERLRREYLQAAGYGPAILLEGADLRGIDVAFLSRLPVVGKPELHPFDTTGIDPARAGDTRGLLEATFRLPDGSLLTGFAVHFPAPFHPTEMRITAYRQLNKLRQALPDDRYVFAAGDFNTTSRENAEKGMLDRYVRPYWTVAHDLGCGDCRGTNYYARDDSWSFLDMLLWSPAEERSKKTTWHIRAGSVRVANRFAGQVTDSGTPARFEMPGASGVSDHWPLAMTIELN